MRKIFCLLSITIWILLSSSFSSSGPGNVGGAPEPLFDNRTTQISSKDILHEPNSTAGSTGIRESGIVADRPTSKKQPMELEKESVPKRILAIFAFKQALPWAYQVEESMRAAIASESPFPIELNVEHADRARYPEETYLGKIIDFYKYKYSGQKFDLILAIGDESAELLIEYGEQMFGDIPIVLISSEAGALPGNLERPHMVSLIWGWDIGKTVELIQNLLPNTQQLYFISGTSKTDLTIKKVAQKALKNTNVKFKAHFITNFDTSEMLERISHLPNDSVIFFLSVLRDKNGEYFVSRDLMHVVSEKANVPTFGMADTYLGHGIVGGNLLSAEHQGQRLIKTAIKIMNGESITSTDLLEGDNLPMFDWHQLQRWSINESDLPPGSIVKYKEHSIWDDHKGKIIGAIVIILLQSLAVILLLIQRKKRNQAESESQVLREDLAHVSRVLSMGEIATSLAHEINQPLTAIQSYAQAAQRFLLKDPPEYEEVGNSLGGVVEGSRRAKEVIQRIRMTLDKQPLERSPQKVRDLINGVLLLVQGKVEENKILLKLDIENRLPKVFGDQVQLQQVLLNLMINGIEAICENGDDVRILIVSAYKEQDKDVVISVKDNGIGIDENMLDHPFEAFYTTKQEGLGMGLSISKSIIEDHGGRLWISKNPNKGVTFSFTVPLYKDILR